MAVSSRGDGWAFICSEDMPFCIAFKSNEHASHLHVRGHIGRIDSEVRCCFVFDEVCMHVHMNEFACNHVCVCRATFIVPRASSLTRPCGDGSCPCCPSTWQLSTAHPNKKDGAWRQRRARNERGRTAPRPPSCERSRRAQGPGRRGCCARGSTANTAAAFFICTHTTRVRLSFHLSGSFKFTCSCVMCGGAPAAPAPRWPTRIAHSACRSQLP